MTNWTPGNKSQENLNQNANVFIEENASEKCRLQSVGHFVQIAFRLLNRATLE